MAVKMGKPYKNIKELLRGEYPDEPELVESFVKTDEKEQLANTLWMMRTRRGVTQAEVAERMGITQSAVAKLEDRGDSVKMSDVASYAEALGYAVQLKFTEIKKRTRTSAVGKRAGRSRVAAKPVAHISGRKKKNAIKAFWAG